MVYTVTIREVRIGKVDVEAPDFETAKAMVEEDYWKHPNDFLLEPNDTFFE